MEEIIYDYLYEYLNYNITDEKYEKMNYMYKIHIFYEIFKLLHNNNDINKINMSSLSNFIRVLKFFKRKKNFFPKQFKYQFSIKIIIKNLRKH